MEEPKVVLVTGSSKGIGAIYVRNFARKGYRTVINYSRSDDEANSLYQEVSSFAGPDNVMIVKADVSKRTQVRDMFDRAIDNFGRVDILINNHGRNLDGPFLKMSDEQWQECIDVILTGTFICSQEFALHFEGETGHIVNVGARTGIVGRTNGANYCSAKAGVITLTKCLALELAPKIRVNCIVSGFIETEAFYEQAVKTKQFASNVDDLVSAIPMGRLGTPDDMFKMVEFIVNSDYITGAKFFVNGGNFMY